MDGFKLAEIVGAITEPLVEEAGGHPAAPADFKEGKQVVLGEPETDGEDGEDDHHAAEIDEVSVVAPLDGIEKGTIPVGEADDDPVLGQGEADDGGEEGPRGFLFVGLQPERARENPERFESGADGGRHRGKRTRWFAKDNTGACGRKKSRRGERRL